MKLVNNKSGGRNYSIDLARVIFAILILALHTSPFSDVNFYIYYTVCHTFSRLAVPFFAAVSGYYFFNNYSDQKAFKCLKKLLIAYGFWTTLSCAVDILFGHVDGNIVRFLLEAYLLKGQHALWYMLAMIYTVLLAMLARKIKVNRYVLMYSIGSFISSGTVEFVVVCMFAFLIGVVLIVMRSKGIKFAYAIS